MSTPSRVEQLEELRRKTAALRKEQKAFFGQPPSNERSRALHAAKALEKQVDELVAQLAGDAPACTACEGRGTTKKQADLYDVGGFGAPCKACGGKGRR